MTAQVRVPDAWVIVDNGSTDGTVEIARELEREHDWIRLLVVPADPSYNRTGAEARAFMLGVDALGRRVDIVVKLDADVSFAPGYFDRLLGEFEHDASLGIASGITLELEGHVWKPQYGTRFHPRGQIRAYRWACWEHVSPLDLRPGWDTIDELRARIGGWRTASILDLPFFHHRRVGARDGRWGKWVTDGALAHRLGYRPSYLLARVLYRMIQNPVAVAMVWGYAKAFLQNQPRYSDASVRNVLREDQRLRHLPTRLREVRGRTEAEV